MRAVGEDFGCELVEGNGETEHVHLLVNVPPTVARSRLVNSLKGGSSRRLRRSSPSWPGTPGGPGGCGRGRTSPARSQVLCCTSCGPPSSSSADPTTRSIPARRPEPLAKA
jgi:REP element-mobilizing transposase RayT